jgi:hypothetical protein
MKLLIKLTLIILCFCNSAIYGQDNKDGNCFSNLFIDRPLLKKDSLALISNKVSKIKLYESISSDSIPTKKMLGEWNIIIENNKIKSIEWKAFYDSLFRVHNYSYVLLGCYPLIKREFFKKKIVDIIGQKNYDGTISQFKLTHLLNKFGQIYLTKNKAEGKLYEDRYIAFSKIEYRYDGDFLIEMAYYSDFLFSEENSLYSRLYFEYYK